MDMAGFTLAVKRSSLTDTFGSSDLAPYQKDTFFIMFATIQPA